MRFLFYGWTKGNSGPDNVNKGIVANLTPAFCYAASKNKYIHMVQLLLMLPFCRVVVASGVARKGAILFRLAGWLGKKKVYIMHGSAVHENRINQRIGNEQGYIQETCLLKCADLILPISKKYMQWVHSVYPEYAYKTKYLTNGIALDAQELPKQTAKQKGVVAAGGGMRLLKNNRKVAQAVEMLNGRATLRIYGGEKEPVELPEYRYSRHLGVLPNEEFLKGLAEAELFVLNSVLESFSIAAVEALLCGCSVLISECAGVTDILALEETDIIHDPMDVDEIRSKIEYLLEHPNHDRLMSKLDLNEWTFTKMVQRLEAMCIELAEKE